MTEPQDINDDLPEIVVLEPDEDVEVETAPDEARRAGWPLLLLGGFAAGILVALAASWFLRPAAYDPSALTAEIETLKAQVAGLEAAPEPEIPTVNLAPLTRRIAALEARPAVDPLNEEIVARMEALQADGFEVPELPDVSGFEADVAALQSRVAELEARPVQVVTAPVESEVAAPTVDPATLPRLPVRALRDGIAELGGSGLIRRTFSRHVRVRGNDEPDRLLDLIIQDMEAGRAQAAIEKFERLPPEVQTLARGWRADMDMALARQDDPT